MKTTRNISVITFCARVASLLLSGVFALILVSCATQEPKVVVGWPGSDVYKTPGGTFWAETLELKDGRFRYWVSTNLVIRGEAKCGSYAIKDDELICNSGKTLKLRQVNGTQVLLEPHLVSDWDKLRIVPGFHILFPVESIDSDPPTKEFIFTKEQIEQSTERLRMLVD